ncbi:hypothetical protein NE865_02670 [Phthorimaea operculella]|nr:hypothetical protein NE865_02670 [Phthorimaea operculella]
MNFAASGVSKSSLDLASFGDDTSNLRRKRTAEEMSFDELLTKMQGLDLKLTKYHSDVDNKIEELSNTIKISVTDQLSKLTELTNTFKEDLKTTRQDLHVTQNNVTKLNTELSSVQEDLSSVKSSVQFNSNQLQDLRKDLAKTQAEMGTYKHHDATISTMQNEITSMQFELNNYQQRERRFNLEISGLPEKHNENLTDYMIKIAKVADVDLKKEDIIHIHRVKPQKHVAGRPKNVVVKLNSLLLKDSIISGIRRNKGISTADLGIGGDARNLYINEHLTPTNKLLLKEVKEAKKTAKFQYVWVRNCKIYVRKDDNSPHHEVKKAADIYNIMK